MAPVFNTALKLAIFKSRKKQKRIAQLARMPETQLSHVVRGRRLPTEKEKRRLCAVLGESEAVLFGGDSTIVSTPGRPESTDKPLLAQVGTEGA